MNDDDNDDIYEQYSTMPGARHYENDPTGVMEMQQVIRNHELCCCVPEPERIVFTILEHQETGDQCSIMLFQCTKTKLWNVHELEKKAN